MENSKRMNKVLAGFFSEGGYVTSEISDGDTFLYHMEENLIF